MLGDCTGAFTPLSCPVDEAFLRSLGWPLHEHYLQARRSGDTSEMLRIRLSHRT